MIYVTSISKTEIGYDVGARGNITLTPMDRKATIRAATNRVLESFSGADLCEIRVVEFHEWGASDLSAARITLDIGGSGYGKFSEVVAK